MFKIEKQRITYRSQDFPYDRNNPIVQDFQDNLCLIHISVRRMVFNTKKRMTSRILEIYIT